MTGRRPVVTAARSDWHLSEPVLDAYRTASVSSATAWSVEEHLMACSRCRAALGRGSLAVTEVRTRLLAELPPQPDVRQGTPARGVRVLFTSSPGAFWAWLVAVVVVLGWALVMDLARVPLDVVGTGMGTDGGAGAGRPTAVWLQLLVPLLPIIGVACSFGSGADPAHELLASTPAGGLRLLLYRCCSVLVTCLPVAAVLGLVTGGIDGVAWLLPALSLTVLTLALGCVVSLATGAAISAALWLAATGVPLLSGQVPRSITVGASPVWVAALAVGACIVLSRPDRVARPIARSSRAH